MEKFSKYLEEVQQSEVYTEAEILQKAKDFLKFIQTIGDPDEVFNRLAELMKSSPEKIDPYLQSLLNKERKG